MNAARWDDATSRLEGARDDARFVVESEGDDLVLRVTGALRHAGSTELLRRLRVLAGLAAGGRLVVDLRGVTLVTDTAINTLTRAQRSFQEIGVPLVLRDPPLGSEAVLAQVSHPFMIERSRTQPDETLGH
jgi:anti-anti-sigma regulatory factor